MKYILFTLAALIAACSQETPSQLSDDTTSGTFTCHQLDWYSGGFYIHQFTPIEDRYQVSSYWQMTTGHGLISGEPHLRTEQEVTPYVTEVTRTLRGLPGYRGTATLRLPIAWDGDSRLHLAGPVFESEYGRYHAACESGPVHRLVSFPTQSDDYYPSEETSPLVVSCRADDDRTLELSLGESTFVRLKWDYMSYRQLVDAFSLTRRPPDGHNSGFLISSPTTWQCLGTGRSYKCYAQNDQTAEIPEARSSVFGHDILQVGSVDVSIHSQGINTKVQFSNADGIEAESVLSFNRDECTRAVVPNRVL